MSSTCDLPEGYAGRPLGFTSQPNLFLRFLAFLERLLSNMKSFAVNAVLSASTWLLWAHTGVADPVAAPAPDSTNVNYNTITYEGCYSEVPDFKDIGTYTYQSPGYCQHQCVPQGYSVMALTNGADCWCGHALPANSTKTDSCKTSCQGWPQNTCT